MAALELVRLFEVGLGLALGICVLLREPKAGGWIDASRSWLSPLMLLVAAFLGLVTASRFGLAPLAAVLVTVGLIAALTNRQRLTVVCFVLASLWLGPWWALLVAVVSPIAMAGLAIAERFDHRLPVWLLGVSAAGATLALPDVEAPTLFAAAYGVIAISTVGRHRRIGAVQHLVPFMLWGFAFSAQGRPPSIVGAGGALGLLLVLPFLGLFGPAMAMPRGRWSWVVVQAVAAVAMARHAGLSATWERPLWVAAMGLAAIAIVVVALPNVIRLVGRGSRRPLPLAVRRG